MMIVNILHFRGGFLPSQSLMIAKAMIENATETNSALFNWFDALQPGQLITNSELGNSLQTIANSGSDGSHAMWCWDSGRLLSNNTV